MYFQSTPISDCFSSLTLILFQEFEFAGLVILLGACSSSALPAVTDGVSDGGSVLTKFFCKYHVQRYVNKKVYSNFNTVICFSGNDALWFSDKDTGLEIQIHQV